MAMRGVPPGSCGDDSAISPHVWILLGPFHNSIERLCLNPSDIQIAVASSGAANRRVSATPPLKGRWCTTGSSRQFLRRAFVSSSAGRVSHNQAIEQAAASA